MPQMSMQLYYRRRQLLFLYYSGRLSKQAMIGLSKLEVDYGFNSSYHAIRVDWSRRTEWEMLIWHMEQDLEDLETLLNYFKLAREEALNLSRSADQDSVKVAAIGRLTEIISKEIELRQSLGKLPKMADRLEAEIKSEHKFVMDWGDLTEDERSFCESVARKYIKASNTGKPASIH